MCLGSLKNIVKRTPLHIPHPLSGSIVIATTPGVPMSCTHRKSLDFRSCSSYFTVLWWSVLINDRLEIVS